VYTVMCCIAAITCVPADLVLVNSQLSALQVGGSTGSGEMGLVHYYPQCCCSVTWVVKMSA